MNTLSNDQIAPEIVQAIIAKATEQGLSVNDYLRRELCLTNVAQPSEQPFYKTAATEEWIREFTKWADGHDPNTPALPIFFFSSRRRHTSCLSDWSSDVCSSD